MMKRFSILFFLAGLLTAGAVHGNVVSSGQEGYFSINYTNASLASVIGDFAAAVGIDISYSDSEFDRKVRNLHIDNTRWQMAFAEIVEPYGYAIHQIQEQGDVDFSCTDTVLMQLGKPFYLIRAEGSKASGSYRGYAEIVRLMQEDLGGHGIVLLAVLFVVALFFVGLPFHWAAKSIGIEDSTIGKGVGMAFLTFALGMILRFFPEVPALFLGVIAEPLLVKRVFGITIWGSILVLVLSLVYTVLFGIVTFFCLFGIWLMATA